MACSDRCQPRSLVSYFVQNFTKRCSLFQKITFLIVVQLVIFEPAVSVTLVAHPFLWAVMLSKLAATFFNIACINFHNSFSINYFLLSDFNCKEVFINLGRSGDLQTLGCIESENTEDREEFQGYSESITILIAISNWFLTRYQPEW